LAVFLHCAVETRWQQFGQFLNDFLRQNLNFFCENFIFFMNFLIFSVKILIGDFLYFFCIDS